MEPSSRHILIAVLIVFTVFDPSAATRGKLAEPSTQPQFFFIPLLPCIPGFPRWLFPCYEPRPPSPPYEGPKECWSPVKKLARPCAEYLTNGSISSPSDDCCDHFHAFDDDAAICFCHIANGDIGKFLSAPLNFTQLFALPRICRDNLRLEAFSHCNSRSYMHVASNIYFVNKH
jgi:hypothetical protein